jgi:hypothetical protein
MSSSFKVIINDIHVMLRCIAGALYGIFAGYLVSCWVT